MQSLRVIAIGASLGGIEAISQILAELPKDLQAAVLIVQHQPARRESMLAAALGRASALPVAFAQHAEQLKPSRVYVAPPNVHLLLGDDYRQRLVQGPRENRVRPAVDPLLRSVAVAAGPRAIGVVLTGNLGDGAAGLAAIHRSGGISVVQSPQDSRATGMPDNAIAAVGEPHYIVPAAQIGPLLAKLVNEEPEPSSSKAPEDIETELDLLVNGRRSAKLLDRWGKRADISCPECGGPLWSRSVGAHDHYRCVVGHAYHETGLVDMQADVVESTLWAALRALEEQHTVLLRLHASATDRGHNSSAGGYYERAEEAATHAARLRTLLARLPSADSADSPSSNVGK